MPHWTTEWLTDWLTDCLKDWRTEGLNNWLMDASVSQEREPDILILLCTANYQHFKCVAAKRKSVNTDKHWQQPTIPHQPQYSRQKITIFPGVHRTSLYAIRDNISTFIYYYYENLYRQQSALHNLSTNKPKAVKAVLNSLQNLPQCTWMVWEKGRGSAESQEWSAA